jgi:predicted RNase H-like HicB family nuclease
LKLPYAQLKQSAQGYEVRIWYSPDPGDECFVAQVVDMPGVMAHGETRADAAREIQVALELALETLQEAGEEPPRPRNAGAVALGQRGGRASSLKKKLAARHNGKRGGRPRKRVAA